MSPQNTVRDWARLLYYFSQNTLSFLGVALTTSSAITLIAFWVYDFVLPGPPHPYIGLLLFLMLPGIFILGLLLIPVGIFLRRKKLQKAGDLPSVYPEIDLKAPMVRHGISFIAVATMVNVMRWMPHRPGGRVVRALQTFRLAAGFRGYVPHLLAANSFSREVPAPGA